MSETDDELRELQQPTGGDAPMIRVLLADDQALVGAGFRALLDAQDGIQVVGAAADGQQAVRLTGTLLPDVVLMDICMPGLDGLASTRLITSDQRLAAVRVVILTTFDLDEYVFEALRVGASGFLVKDTEPVELIRGVRAVAAGGALLSPGVTRRLIAAFAAAPSPPRPVANLDLLTDREREVLALVGAGLSNQEIAERLVVSPATAKTHVSRAMVKLHARDRARLVVLAYESFLVRPSWLGAATQVALRLPGRPRDRRHLPDEPGMRGDHPRPHAEGVCPLRRGDHLGWRGAGRYVLRPDRAAAGLPAPDRLRGGPRHPARHADRTFRAGSGARR